MLAEYVSNGKCGLSQSGRGNVRDCGCLWSPQEAAIPPPCARWILLVARLEVAGTYAPDPSRHMPSAPRGFTSLKNLYRASPSHRCHRTGEGLPRASRRRWRCPSQRHPDNRVVDSVSADMRCGRAFHDRVQHPRSCMPRFGGGGRATPAHARFGAT